MAVEKGRFRLAVAGMGLRGVSMTEMMLGQFPDIEIVGLADAILPRAELSRDFLGLEVPCFDRIEHCLDETRPEALAVFTPDAFHAGPAVAALERNVHVFCEKPMALSLKDCDAMIAAAQASGAVFHMGFNLRHAPYFSTIHELIAGGDLGDLLTLEMNEYYAGGRTYYRRWNRLTRLSGGLWLTKATHDFDAMRWLAASEPSSVCAVGGRKLFLPRPGAGPRCSECALSSECDDYQPPETATGDEHSDEQRRLSFWRRWQELGSSAGYLPADSCLYRGDTDTIEYGAVVVKFANGACASYTMNVVTTPQASGRWLMALGTRGTLRADPLRNVIEVSYRGGGRAPKLYDLNALAGTDGHGGGDNRIMAAFVECCRQGRKPASGWADGRAAVAMGLAATRSMKTGRAVRLGG